MIIHAISRYQASDIKAREAAVKPYRNQISKTPPKDTYEASGADVREKVSASDVRKDLLKTVKRRIGTGFYNSKDVLEDLSNSFAKALHQTIS